MIEDEARLLDAIRAEAADDGPRLVYADWLSQRGDARGEQIVISCKLESELPPDERRRLTERARAIAPKLPFLGFRYELPVDTLVLGELDTFSRGFVPASRVFSHVEEFAARKDDLYRLAPGATTLWMYNFGNHPPWRDVLADPDVTRWGGIDGLPTEQLATAAAQPHLDALRRLVIEATEGEEEDALDPILDAGRFPNLESLVLRGMNVDGMAPGLPPIDPARWRRAAFAPTLREFDGEMLDTLDVFPKLESFSSIFYGREWLLEIISCSNTLRELDVGGYDEDDLDMVTLLAMLRAPCLRSLDSLRLSLDRDASHVPRAWQFLAPLPLTKLALTGNWVDEALVRSLPPLPNLRELRFHRRYQPLEVEALRALFARDWSRLLALDLGTGPYPAALVVSIVERLPALRRLRCAVDDALALVDAVALQHLEVLEVHTGLRPGLPRSRMTAMRALQFRCRYDGDGFDRRGAALWAADRDMELLGVYSGLRNRGDDALTFVRRSVWR